MRTLAIIRFCLLLGILLAAYGSPTSSTEAPTETGIVPSPTSTEVTIAPMDTSVSPIDTPIPPLPTLSQKIILPEDCNVQITGISIDTASHHEICFVLLRLKSCLMIAMKR